MNKKLYISLMFIMMPTLAFTAQADPARGQDGIRDLMEKQRRIACATHQYYVARDLVESSQQDPVRLHVAKQNLLRARFALREADPVNILFEGNQVLKRYAERYGPDTWHPL